MNKVVLVGTISNAGDTLEKDLRRVLNALVNTEVLQIYIVESDSQDNTLNVLENLSIRFPFLNFESLGSLKSKFPGKISRIRFCRQRYVDFIRTYMKTTAIDFVIVVDLDGMNKSIKAQDVDESFLEHGWDVVLANQTGGYYDLLALRHPTWCPNDIKSELLDMQSKVQPSQISRFHLYKRAKRLIELDNVARKVVYSRMQSIPKKSPWVEVESGFGGFAIYKAKLFQEFDYSVKDLKPSEECEHVAFNLKIHESGGNLFINPSLVNNRFNGHNIRRFFLVRQLQSILWALISSTSRFRKTFWRSYN